MESFPIGKVRCLDLHPLTFYEFLAGIGKDRLAGLIREHDLSQSLPDTAHEQLWKLGKRYRVVGGLPEMANRYRERQENLYEAVQSVRKTQRELRANNITRQKNRHYLPLYMAGRLTLELI